MRIGHITEEPDYVRQPGDQLINLALDVVWKTDESYDSAEARLRTAFERTLAQARDELGLSVPVTHRPWRPWRRR